MKDKLDIQERFFETPSQYEGDALGWVLGQSDSLADDYDPPLVGEIHGEADINGMIEALKKQRETLPHHSAFGDDNWERIDTEIVYLKWCLQ